MSETPETTTPEARPCLAVGALVVDGVRKAWLRCDREAGHDCPTDVCEAGCCDEPRTPHRAAFEWLDDEAHRDDWPEAYDPAEPLDVEVPLLTDDELEAIARDAHVDEQVDAEREARAFDE
jgi:hypothetical protein